MLVDRSNTLYKGTFEKGKLKDGSITKKTENDEVIYHFSGELSDGDTLTGKGSLSIEIYAGNDAMANSKRSLEGSFLKGNLNG